MYLQAGVSKRLGAGSHEQGINEDEEPNIAQARREPKEKCKWKGNEKEKNARPWDPPNQCLVLHYQIVCCNNHREGPKVVIVFLIERLSR
jgi:hypothetical protein